MTEKILNLICRTNYFTIEESNLNDYTIYNKSNGTWEAMYIANLELRDQIDDMINDHFEVWADHWIIKTSEQIIIIEIISEHIGPDDVTINYASEVMSYVEPTLEDITIRKLDWSDYLVIVMRTGKYHDLEICIDTLLRVEAKIRIESNQLTTSFYL